MKLDRLMASIICMAMVVGMLPTCVLADRFEFEANETEISETDKPNETGSTKSSEKEKPESTDNSPTETILEESEKPTVAEPVETKNTLPSDGGAVETPPSETEPKETEENKTAETEQTEPSGSSADESIPEETIPEQTAKRNKKSAVARSGSFGEDVTWTLDDQGELVISGTGEINTSSFLYNSNVKKVTITDGISAIGNRAFYNFYYMTEISIPNSVQSIGAEAFKSCGSLKKVIIPNGVKKIENSTFMSCRALTDVVLPDGLTSIGDSAFYYCESLSNISIPESVMSIGSSAFYGCEKLTGVTVAAELVDPNVFENCIGLTDVTFTGSVNSISQNSFAGCTSLKTITLTNSVTECYADSFKGCDSIQTINYSGSYEEFSKIVVYQFDNVSSVLTRKPMKAVFTDLFPKARVKFPDNSVSVYYVNFEVEGKGKASATPSIGVNGTAVELHAVAEKGYKFKEWKVLSGSVTLADSTNIKTTFSFGASDVKIQAVFELNTSSDPTIIDYGTCGTNLSWSIDENGKLTIYSTGASSCMKDWTFDNFESFNVPWKDYISDIKTVDITAPIKSVGSYSFWGCANLTSVSLPDGLQTIGAESFENCSRLSVINFPDSLTTIYGQAFINCNSLAKVDMPNSVKTIGLQAFGYCKNLSEVVISNNVKEIPRGAFYYCVSLENVTIPASVTSIGMESFQGCAKLSSITFPNSVKTIGEYAFMECTGLTDIVLPESVTSIGRVAFYMCSGITSVTIPDSVTTIGQAAFDKCTNLTEVHYGGTQDDWNNIAIGKDNETLLNANIIFNPNPAPKYSITVSSGSTNMEKAAAGTTIRISAIIPYNKTFDKWEVVSGNVSLADASEPNTTFVMPSENVELKATFKQPVIPTYSVVVTCEGKGTASASPVSGTAATPVTLSATPDSGFYFKEWKVISGGVKLDDPLSVTTTFKITSSNVEIKAVFEEIVPAVIGEKDVVCDIAYTVTNNAINGTGTVSYCGVDSSVSSDPNYSPVETISIPSTIQIKGVTYKITAVAANAFYNNISLKTLTIGANVTSIGNNAFYGCTSLTKVSGGANVKTIGANAFAKCTKLSSFTITSTSLSKIGTYAFNKDSKLKTLYIKNTTKLTKKGVKKSLKGSLIKTVKVKKSKVKKYKKFFTKKNCGRKVKVKK